MEQNVVLIGMSGAGKSTLGVLLAKALGMGFVDTDIVIQQTEGRTLQAILDNDGIAAFLSIESRAVETLRVQNTVIATGGSVVYSEVAVRELKRTGKLVYLKVQYPELERRLTNLVSRGIVMKPGETLRDVYLERQPLYEKYADVIVDCSSSDIEGSLKRVIESLGCAN